MPKTLLFVVLALLPAFTFAQQKEVSSAEPEFLRTISCTDLARLDKAAATTRPFWFVEEEISVPGNTSEYIVHRSGKVIRLCPGKYTIDKLRSLLNENAACTMRSEVKVVCPPAAVYHAPVLVAHKKHLIYQADTVHVQLSKSADVKVIVGDLFGDPYVSYSFNGDLVPVAVRLEGYGQSSVVSINTQSTFDDITLLRPATEKIASMAQLLADVEKQTSSAAPVFTQMSRAYLLGVNGFDLEALALLRVVANSNDDPFFQEAYKSFRDLLESHEF